MPNEIIQYTGNFKTIRDIADWINNFSKSTTVEVEQLLTEGVEIAVIKVGTSSTSIFAPEQQEIEVTAIQHSGKHIADITVDGTTTELYAPNGGGGGSTFFEENEYTDINGNTVTALYQIPEVQVGSSDAFFYMDEYTDINGNTVNALYQSQEV